MSTYDGTLNFFLARSTWVMFFAVVVNIQHVFGLDVAVFTQADADAMVELVNALSVAWYTLERVTGTKKLVKPGHVVQKTEPALARRRDNRG